jgi:hypothetical protein
VPTKVEEGNAIADPTTSMAEIVKFASILQSMSMQGEVDLKTDWNTTGFKQKSIYGNNFSNVGNGWFTFSFSESLFKSCKNNRCCSILRCLKRVVAFRIFCELVGLVVFIVVMVVRDNKTPR